MWLNGFNDNLPGFPRLPCKYIPCSDPYMGLDAKQPNTPVDSTKPIQGPFGTGMSGPSFGYCPVDRDWSKESSGNPQTGRDWVRAPPNMPHFLDDTDNVMSHLASKKINAFSGIGHGFYFWNFRTDLNNPQWSYMLALERGWIPKGNLGEDKILNACHAEDSGLFRCILKKHIPDQPIIDAIHYINDVTANSSITPSQRAIESMTGKELRVNAGPIVDLFFQNGRGSGVTCDFGGIGVLVEENSTISEDDDDDDINKMIHNGIFDDDEYYTTVVINTGLGWVYITIYIILGTLVGSAIGFLVAMRMSKKFNKAVRKSTFFQQKLSPILSNNELLRKSLALPPLRESLEELNHLYDEDEEEAHDADVLAKENAKLNSGTSVKFNKYT